MLEVRGVSKRYGKVLANNDVTFDVKNGETAILLGPNGAGKSTLVKCVIGLLGHTGTVTVDGFDGASIDAKKLTGYVPEIPRIYDALTVSEHLEFMRRLYMIEDDGWGRELMERFEMTENAGKLGKELSKGMQQKLSIMCAVIQHPTMVVFDEPITGLDPHAIKELKRLIEELRAGGASVLISTHMIDSIENMWNVAYIMDRGRIVAEKRPGDENGRSLEDMFFEVTEGRRQKAEEEK